MQSDDEFLEELRKEFLAEATSLLDLWEESFLNLEDAEDKSVEITNIFRVAHSIKGTSSAVGYSDMAAFAHIVEDLLSLIKKDPNSLSPEIVSLLLKCGDAMRHKMNFLMGSETKDWEVEDLSVDIKKFIGQLDGSSPYAHQEAAPVDSEEVITTVEAPVAKSPTEAAPIVLDPLEDDSNWKNLLAEVNQALGVNITEADLVLSDEEILKKVESQKKGKTQAPAAVQATPAPVAVRPKEAAPAPQVASPVIKKSEEDTENKKAPSDSHATANKNATVKVDAHKIDKIMNLIGELVINKSQLANRVEQYKDDHQLEATYSLLEKTIRELQDETLGIRMISLKNLFLKCQRAVRDVSLKLGKTIEFIQDGEDVQIDRSMVELLTDPLLHMLRNAADHGIESDDERQMGNKGNGKIILKAEHVGSKIIIQIKDNGKGIDCQRVFAKAKQNGLIPETANFNDFSENQIFQFIMLPGFSTAEKITDVSGRGVGLDVVKTSIEKLNGKVEIESTLGLGTRFRLILPLTTSILEGIHVKSSARSYIFPTEKVLEILSGNQISYVQDPSGATMFKYRDHVIPYATLDSRLGLEDEFRLCRMILILEIDGKNFGVGIDEFVAQVHVVLKPINDIVKTSNAISASCILSHGGIGLVIDTDEVCKSMVKINIRRNQAA